MTLIYPATADAFRCIADACRHTCCKGWEIDIDPNTRAKYAAMTGEIGQRLRDAIVDGTLTLTIEVVEALPSFAALELGPLP